ncbi:MAPK-activated protein kinase Srk1 [Tritrichomonas musculus]|uniref:MAPK-activated protein kinase Srk1 n=1 Tax=Tritrichomonas musculus TaxID=1915356 RepID=A0ABR2H1T2_9EUKA
MIENLEKETERAMKAPDLMSEEDEENKKVIKKIGEGATSIAYKVIDTQTSQEMCKKVIKSVDESESFKKLKNSMKEIETLSNIEHPSILSGDWLQFKRETS